LRSRARTRFGREPSGPDLAQGHRMSLRMSWIAVGSWVVLALPGMASADERREPEIPMAIGFNVDILPTALSAANGRLGYAPQVWLGIGHARIRFVGAHLEPPKALAFAPGHGDSLGM